DLNRLAICLDIAADAVLARGRPDVVDLVGSLERCRSLWKFQPRQLAPREYVHVGRDSVGVVECPGSNEQRLAAGRDLVTAPNVGAALIAEERLVILTGASLERE